ncbi:MAG TPA: response regulator [Caldimonas sp.]|jgi:CheY-like chemotaxis protein
MANAPAAHILIVEDDGALLEVLRYVLEDEGYQVSTADNGPDALQLIATTRIDLVVLDCSMSKMAGFDVARTLRADQRTSHVPIALHTGLPEDAVRTRFTDYDLYMAKADDADALTGSIRRALAAAAARAAANPSTAQP